jgi:hypothetical protein
LLQLHTQVLLLLLLLLPRPALSFLQPSLPALLSASDPLAPAQEPSPAGQQISATAASYRLLIQSTKHQLITAVSYC